MADFFVLWSLSVAEAPSIFFMPHFGCRSMTGMVIRAYVVRPCDCYKKTALESQTSGGGWHVKVL